MNLFSRLTNNHRNLIAAIHDAVMAFVSFLLAVYVRLGDEKLDYFYNLVTPGAAIFTLVCMVSFFYMRLYRGLWRYASMRDVEAITKAVSLSILIFAALMFLFNRLDGLPRSVLFINWMLLLIMLGAPRFAYRAIRDKTLRWSLSNAADDRKVPVLLLGASDAAEQFIRSVSRDNHSPYLVVGIVDGDPAQKNRSIHRVPIYGGTDILPTIVRKLKRKGKAAQKLILTEDDISGEEIQSLLLIADELGLPLARLPKLSELKQQGLDDKPKIRSIAVEDLLGRPQNVRGRDEMRNLVHGKRIIITGAGGTIGGELTRQVASYQPSELVLIEHSELGLYQIEREIRGTHPKLPLVTVLCDVRDIAHMEAVFAAHKPQLVFHAAAIKHVPIAEFNIEEAILTNVFGSKSVADCCLAHGVEAMVMISTDKAVNPTNVMGASKRLAESYCQALGALNNGKTKFVTVRFGNVLGSTGSVVPLFQEQLAKGGPITVTHPDMTRYFMTVREAVELVLQAAVLGVSMDRQECIFVLDMGKPVKIVDLARQMILLAGLRPDEDIKITFTGLRPGEKLFEELFHISENLAKTSHDSILLASPRFCDMEQLRTSFEALLHSASHRSAEEALSLLKQLVPEFAHAKNL
ncbi:MAG: polysaccharide biosynthesis protein [Alphaproteobacteria bacterium]|nr:polysaccharide biosynthesis protein [Alphaproteobacteria bacterium]